jgi:photolyase PhrII
MEAVHEQLFADLPEHLVERTRCIKRRDVPPHCEFVLYWLHHAMRAHENPALDVAVTAANRLGLPLLVYQAIPERYPYASDRHHTFMLEGARDLQQQFNRRGLFYAFHLERRSHRGAHLPGLAERAAVVVTEDMPVQPLRGWTTKLAASTKTPVLCVDTACVAPMLLVGKAYERAFQFRKATQQLYHDRVQRSWEDVEPEMPGPIPNLPFTTLDLSTSDLDALLAECEIDHSVAPVPHTRGGSEAGYARWETFKQHGLNSYARLRNNPLVDGTSRLSPYLHYGMVSPLRIAREAAESRTQGADKFLDELLIWRELAYAFCFYRQEHESFAALPAWARDTLDEHKSDARPAIHSWETLARGRTGDRLWDAAQRSLLIHGELHNNVRMTWGKALLNWTPDAQTALAMMIDLNHRYALDGRDPASYGGILWCLGQFDRPFTPARPILGTVRDRSTEEHAKRLDTDRYRQETTRPLWNSKPRVAIIGAGMSGLICARTLLDHGIAVSVFEKSRGVGGRMATRRTAGGPRFDHGAQYFTVRDIRFERYVESWIRDGIVAPWEGRIVTLTNGHVEPKQKTTPRFVPVPGMNAVCKHLAADLDIRLQTQVSPPQVDQGIWRLDDVQGQRLGEFDYVVTTAPSAQSSQLLACSPELQKQAQSSTMNGCWAGMIAFERPLEIPFDGAFVHESLLSWIARNDSKPDRGHGAECWVLHASPQWTMENLEAEPDEVLPQLIDAFWQSTGSERSSPSYAASHRWRFSTPVDPLESRCLFDPHLRIGACGDWCSGPRVEGAFLSGMALAGRVLSHASQARS